MEEGTETPARLVKPQKAKTELAELKRALEHAIEMEEFEKAAQVRDQIREMEQRGRSKKGEA